MSEPLRWSDLLQKPLVSTEALQLESTSCQLGPIDGVKEAARVAEWAVDGLYATLGKPPFGAVATLAFINACRCLLAALEHDAASLPSWVKTCAAVHYKFPILVTAYLKDATVENCRDGRAVLLLLRSLVLVISFVTYPVADCVAKLKAVYVGHRDDRIHITASTVMLKASKTDEEVGALLHVLGSGLAAPTPTSVVAPGPAVSKHQDPVAATPTQPPPATKVKPSAKPVPKSQGKAPSKHPAPAPAAPTASRPHPAPAAATATHAAVAAPRLPEVTAPTRPCGPELCRIVLDWITAAGDERRRRLGPIFAAALSHGKCFATAVGTDASLALALVKLEPALLDTAVTPAALGAVLTTDTVALLLHALRRAPLSARRELSVAAKAIHPSLSPEARVDAVAEMLFLVRMKTDMLVGPHEGGILNELRSAWAERVTEVSKDELAAMAAATKAGKQQGTAKTRRFEHISVKAEQDTAAEHLQALAILVKAGRPYSTAEWVPLLDVAARLGAYVLMLEDWRDPSQAATARSRVLASLLALDAIINALGQYEDAKAVESFTAPLAALLAHVATGLYARLAAHSVTGLPTWLAATPKDVRLPKATSHTTATDVTVAASTRLLKSILRSALQRKCGVLLQTVWHCATRFAAVTCADAALCGIAELTLSRSWADSLSPTLHDTVLEQLLRAGRKQVLAFVCDWWTAKETAVLEGRAESYFDAFCAGVAARCAAVHEAGDIGWLPLACSVVYRAVTGVDAPASRVSTALRRLPWESLATVFLAHSSAFGPSQSRRIVECCNKLQDWQAAADLADAARADAKKAAERAKKAEALRAELNSAAELAKERRAAEKLRRRKEALQADIDARAQQRLARQAALRAEAVKSMAALAEQRQRLRALRDSAKADADKTLNAARHAEAVRRTQQALRNRLWLVSLDLPERLANDVAFHFLHYPDTTDAELLEYVVAGKPSVPEDLLARLAASQQEARAQGMLLDEAAIVPTRPRRGPRGSWADAAGAVSSNPITSSGAGSFDAFDFWASLAQQEEEMNPKPTDQGPEEAAAPPAPAASEKSLHERLSFVLDAFAFHTTTTTSAEEGGSSGTSIEVPPVELRALVAAYTTAEVQSWGFHTVRHAVDIAMSKKLLLLRLGWLSLTPLGVAYHHPFHDPAREVERVVERNKQQLRDMLAATGRSMSSTLGSDDHRGGMLHSHDGDDDSDVDAGSDKDGATSGSGDEDGDDGTSRDERVRTRGKASPTRYFSDDLFA